VNRKLSFQIPTIDGHNLAVDLFLPEIQGTEKLDLIVYCHGFKGFKDWGFAPHLNEFLVTENSALLTFNHSHNGVIHRDFDDLESFANNTVGQELRDLESLAQWIVQDGASEYGFNTKHINWLGHSRGGANVVLFAHLFPEFVNKIVTWAAIDSYELICRNLDLKLWQENGVIYIDNARTKQQMPMNFFIWEEYQQHKERYNVIAAAQSLTKPWLIIHGTADESVPFTAAENLYQACAHSILYPVKNASHTFGVSHPLLGLQEVNEDFWLMMDETLAFFEDQEI
jgi:pimeloyl-ACP methyl ester carboxylesterase